MLKFKNIIIKLMLKKFFRIKLMSTLNIKNKNVIYLEKKCHVFSHTRE